MLDVLLDALIDSLKVFGIAFIIYVIISFFENKHNNAISKNKPISKLYASLLGVIPQCGFSMVASDMYLKRKVSMGVLIATFIATSDEAFIIMLSSPTKEMIITILVMMGLKIVLGTLMGILIDVIFPNPEIKEDEEEHNPSCHDKHGLKERSKVYLHLVHPLIHAAEIFAYALGINLVLGTIIHFTGGEDAFAEILQKANNFGPLISWLIGLVPNCASSVALTKVYMLGGISFGSLFAGLSVNAGLGMLYLFKARKNIKNTLLILLIMSIFSIIVGYIIHFIMMLF